MSSFTNLLDNPDFKAHFKKSGDSLIIKPDPPRFTMLAASETFLKLLTMSEADVIGKGVFEVFSDDPADPSGAENARRALKAVIDSHQIVEIRVNKYAIPTKTGKLRDTYWTVINTPVINRHGDIEYIINNSRNITEQVLRRQKEEAVASELERQRGLAEEREKALLRANDNLSFALESAKLGFYELDLASGVIKCTDQYKANLGLAPDYPVDRTTLFSLMSEEYRDGVYTTMLEAIKNKAIYTTEYEVRWPDGSIHWIRVFGKPRYKPGGEPDTLTGVTLSVTEQKQMEQQRDDLLGIASHEFKTPITSLKVSLQLLSRLTKTEQVSEKVTELIDQANSSLKKLIKLVDDLLSLSKVQEGKIKLEKTEFTLSQLIDDCCNHVRIMGIHDLIITGDRNLRVYADSQRIDQVIINLVNNAVKYAPHSKEILINIEQVDGYAKVSVTDKGPGIPPEKQAYLFKRYYQAKAEGNMDTGLGLGLYISAEIINQHNGRIGVESTPGKGSTFWFTIPLR